MSNAANSLLAQIESRVDESFAELDSDAESSALALPRDDPHIRDFLNATRDRQGLVGYCLHPLIEYVSNKLGDDLSFIVVAYATPQQLRPDLAISELDFCAINNYARAEQLKFRKIFRFVGSENFSRTSIQTSKILLEHPIEGADPYDNYIYSFRHSFQDEIEISNSSKLKIIPVKELAIGVLDSDYFKGLESYLSKAIPENISEELARQFERFFRDGDLEKDVVAERPTTGESLPTEPHPIVERFNRNSLKAFEPLLTTFGLRRSAELRRRFLNYFAWMKLCDRNINFYAYFVSIEQDLPQAEFIIASKGDPDLELASDVREISGETFKKIFKAKYGKDRDKSGNVRSYREENLPATLNVERKAIHAFLASKWREQNATEILARKCEAILGLDDAIQTYVGPIVSATFQSSPHQHLSLEPFWTGNLRLGSDTSGVLNDLTLNALKDEFESRGRQPESRVNPFLIALYPVSRYLAQELESLRDPRRLAKSISRTERFLSAENRLPGELPLDPSGILSMNVVFWDIATRQFRYCSVSFVNNDAVFRQSFGVFFRLIEDIRPTSPSRGILDSVLLMSDILFRESVGEIKPICITFNDPIEIRGDEEPLSKRYPPLSVAQFINYLNDKKGGRAAFDELYHNVLMAYEDTPGRQAQFEKFCLNTPESGVGNFIRFASQKLTVPKENEPAETTRIRERVFKAKEMIKAVQVFLAEHQANLSDPNKAVAKFLGYITWLWLCYRDRLAYYYYVPAQLPFNERIGGFAIATEIPIPDDILDFLFTSVAPRIVAHPALLHHRGAAAELSREISTCWFDSLPHLITNTIGIKDLRRDLDSIVEDLSKVEVPSANSQGIIDNVTNQLGRVAERLREATPLANRLGSMFDAQDENNLLSVQQVLEVCMEISTGYALKTKVNLIYPKKESIAQTFRGIQLHSPVILILLHLVLNACDEAEASAEKNVGDRIVRIALVLVEHGNGIQISVKNPARRSSAESLMEGPQAWHGLRKDRETLETLWLPNPKMRAVETIIPRIDCGSGDRCEVEVIAYVPARYQRNPKAPDLLY
jgi:hypothetical protein